MMLTICYQTCRRENKIEWFFSSLLNQMEPMENNLSVVVIDFYADERVKLPFIECMAKRGVQVIWVEPKPCVWQGRFRLTKENWFAASNSRNTGLCLAPDGFIAYVDDLSVLMPGWLTNVKQSMSWNGITLGAYKKVKNIQVENGIVKSFDEYNGGNDSRWGHGSDRGSVECPGQYLFGCSLLAPTEALLKVGAWPELADGLSFEDSLLGCALANAGYKFCYNRNMLTFESEELHHNGPQFIRRDKGISPNDKSHAALNMVLSGCKYFANYVDGGIPKLRESVLAGEPFPIVQIPDRDWYDGQLINEMV